VTGCDPQEQNCGGSGGNGGCPSGYEPVSGGCAPKPGPGGTGGSPDPDPGSGGCNKGYHLTNSGCMKDGGGPDQAQLPQCTGQWVGDQCVSKSAIHDGQAKAYNAAQTAASVFTVLGIVFTLLAGILALIGGSNWFVAPILTGLTAAFLILAAQAFTIAVIYGGEGHSTGASTDLNLGWFTHANINAQQSIIHGIALGMSSVLAGLEHIAPLLDNLGVSTALTTAERVAKLNTFGITFSLTELFGGMVLSRVATHFGDEQEGDVLT